MSKFALIIANTEYLDKKFEKLSSPGKDAEEFAQVLRDLAGFDVQVLLNEEEGKISRAISRFCKERKLDDLSLIYFSGHGLRNDQGHLFLATTDTEIELLDATSIASEFITSAMDSSRSRRQLLILDCCNSGAFAFGRKAPSGVGSSMGMAAAFQGNGFGRVVLTATDATQYALEGDKVIGNTQNSVFTHFLIKGLKGEADRNGDGRIDIDELYDYTYEQVVHHTPKQTPKKWSYQQQGEIVLRENIKSREVKSIPLPSELKDILSQSSSTVRLAGVQDLVSLLNGQHPGLARAAQERLQEISKTDDSNRVREVAAKALSGKEQLPPEPTALETKPERVTRKRGFRMGLAGGFLAISALVFIGWMIYANLPNIPAPTSTSEPTEPAITVVITDTSLPPPEKPVVITASVEPKAVGEDNMSLVLIPAGEFPMGSTGNTADERPVHTVYLEDYFIDQTEVTNSMYAACVDKGICDVPKSDTSITQNASNNGSYYGNPKFDNYPVVFVSWKAAKKYCQSVGRRLPTEAEWEKAASWDVVRGTKRLYPWGKSIDCSYANFYGGENETLCVGDTTPVEKYSLGMSPYGVYDMAGNVWEWVADRYDPEYYSDSPYTDPQGPRSGDFIVIRGGSFLVGRSGLRTSDREKMLPDNTSHNVGFRCAMDAKP